MDNRPLYLGVAATFADLVARVPADRLSGPGLGEWSLRDLIGHTVSAALRPIAPAEAERPAAESPEGYAAIIRTAPPEMIAAGQASVDRNARDFGRALGARPETVVREHLDRAAAALDAVGDDHLVVTPIGAMRLGDWLPTRTLELVVHGSDVAQAAGVDVTFDAGAVAESAALAARMAAAIGAGLPLLRALTGREPLPAGFTTVL
ncbi:uncharacterized protein (TIGR03083 family) [Catenuloplanes nepalensis]|uniref:Uncharacterized protein (TIGR03083 family) n=1 Tax=Catenuloplanes nepalensis TaxID=587533 RepID=A0ABT9MYG8_9ACTN|nr:maleylpyruvate isomerase N-terminal domain-containing protein [Catenuloplanes nepalensis]MDP9796086.1 uncharacterized protein (TIGR03083 family) [Catenuloplanes nepalensis]